MATNAEYAHTKDMVNAVVHTAEKLEAAASILVLLEDKSDSERVTAAELAAVRSIVETCASDLNEAWKNI